MSACPRCLLLHRADLLKRSSDASLQKRRKTGGKAVKTASGELKATLKQVGLNRLNQAPEKDD